MENNIIYDKVLYKHAGKGCVSDIPPSAGTNQNEALHSQINPHFRRCRMGLPMALASTNSPAQLQMR